MQQRPAIYACLVGGFAEGMSGVVQYWKLELLVDSLFYLYCPPICILWTKLDYSFKSNSYDIEKFGLSLSVGKNNVEDTVPMCDTL